MIKLNYQLALTGAGVGFNLDTGASVGFGGNSLLFQCQYARSVTVDETYDFDPIPDDLDPIVGLGNLSYDITVNVPNTGVGGTTTVSITPRHNLPVGAV